MKKEIFWTVTGVVIIGLGYLTYRFLIKTKSTSDGSVTPNDGSVITNEEPIPQPDYVPPVLPNTTQYKVKQGLKLSAEVQGVQNIVNVLQGTIINGRTYTSSGKQYIEFVYGGFLLYAESKYFSLISPSLNLPISISTTHPIKATNKT